MTINSATAGMDIPIEDAIEAPRLRIQANPSNTYGWWITNKGKIIEVDYLDHENKLAELFPGDEAPPEVLKEWVISQGWIRIANFVKQINELGLGYVREMNVNGLRQHVIKRWDTIYDLAVRSNAKSIYISWVDADGGEVTESRILIEDAIKPPRVRIQVNPHRYKWF